MRSDADQSGKSQTVGATGARAGGRKPRSTWFVSYETSRQEKRPFVRQTETFTTEQEAKQFAKSKLVETLNITAGTLNPYQPRHAVTSMQVPDWVDEPDEA